MLSYKNTILYGVNTTVAFIFLLQGIWGLTGVPPPRLYWILFLVFVAFAIFVDSYFFYHEHREFDNPHIT